MTHWDTLEPTEAQSQIAFVSECRMRGIPVVHIPNEGVRTQQQGAYLNMMGMSKGFPDLLIPRAANGYHGLFIEMKTKDGSLKPEQRKWLRDLRSEHYYCAVCHSSTEAIETLDRYLKG